jgi:cytochrome c553
MDGTAMPRATNQYENCLRCHGPATERKPIGNYGYLPARTLYNGDQYDVSKQFANTVSSHAVMRQELNDKAPHLLDNIWDVTFKKTMRPVTGQMLCTDCHNSDDNREFGGLGPNGVHGSQFEHILERRYVISKPSAGPGSLISNLQKPPDLSNSPLAPYALCAKCHNMDYINSTSSWAWHNQHIQNGYSCSVCHSAHGVANGTSGVPGTGLVSFDMNVVAPNHGVVSWDGNVTCTLTCHEHPHN